MLSRPKRGANGAGPSADAGAGAGAGVNGGGASSSARNGRPRTANSKPGRSAGMGSGAGSVGMVVYDDTGREDPLTRAMAPPPNETDAERQERLAAELEAKRISDLIDEELNRQRAAERKGPPPVKILLLGQSESGKSTTLKNFQLMNSPKTFKEERLSWRAVVQLNVVRSVRLILDAILDASLASSSPTSPATPMTPVTPGAPMTPGSPSSPMHYAHAQHQPYQHPQQQQPRPESLITQHHLALRQRLLPLLKAEDVLIHRLIPVAAATGTALREIENAHTAQRTRSGTVTAGTVNVNGVAGTSASAGNGTTDGGDTTGSGGGGGGGGGGGALVLPSKPPGAGGREVSVFAGSAWKTAFTRILRPSRNSSGSGSSGGGGLGEDGIDWEDAADPTRVLASCGPDLMRLWADESVRTLLRVMKIRLEEMPGFFLDLLDRITQLNYLPTDDDILRARLKTLGVTEYRFTMKAGNALSHDWRVYDVGGQRSLRAAWVPFFDDMNAIIFLAPISCFDQVLMEDTSVNRLEDSVLLWKSVVKNPLLAKTNLVLFLNKCDVLRAKLNAGIRLGKYVISYGDRPNDFEHASDYLRRKFYHIFQEHSPNQRPFYCHFTSVTDTRTTSVILENVTDMVVRANLKSSALIP